MKSTKRTQSRDNPPTLRHTGVTATGKTSINRSRQETNERSASNSSLSSTSQDAPAAAASTTVRKHTSQPLTTTKTSATVNRGDSVPSTSTVSPMASQQQHRSVTKNDLALNDGARTKERGKNSANTVIDNRQRQQKPPLSGASKQRHTPPATSTSRQINKHRLVGSSDSKRRQIFRETSRDQSEDTSSSSQEMTTTSTNTSSSMRSDATLTPFQGGNVVAEQETTLDSQLGPSHNNKTCNGDDTEDDECTTLLESPKMQPISRAAVSNSDCLEPSASNCANMSQMPNSNPKSPLVLYHDDEEINYQSSSLAPGLVRLQPTTWRNTSTDDDYEEDDLNELLSNGAALTMADDDQITTLHSEEVSFVVYPLGCCEFDETQLVSATSTRAIQKCILRLSNKPTQEEAMCWGLGQSQPILMRLLEDHIQFTDINSQTLLRSQPIQTIKTWAVDDDNNFAFVVEENPHQSPSTIGSGPIGTSEEDTALDYALLNGPMCLCYVFRSMDDDDMSCRVAAKLNEEITRYREQMSNRVSKSTRLQQMIVVDHEQGQKSLFGQQQHQQADDQTTDLDADELDELVEATNELSMSVKYIGKVQVPRPVGIDVLNVAIDKCLADASKMQMNRLLSMDTNGHDNTSDANSDEHKSNNTNSDCNDSGTSAVNSPLIDANLHVSPSSVIVENVQTGEIIVECRIRYLTFMGISRRDIRWCGFIMQNTTNKTFVAHCFECYPTAGHVCEAIQASCSKMYEKIVKGQKTKQQQQQDATTSIMPNSSKIRDTLAKTLSRIKLTPII